MRRCVLLALRDARLCTACARGESGWGLIDGRCDSDLERVLGERSRGMPMRTHGGLGLGVWGWLIEGAKPGEERR